MPCMILKMIPVISVRRAFLVLFLTGFTLWVGPASIAVAEHPNIRVYGGFDGLPQCQVMAIAQDHRGFIWLGTYGGLSRFDGREFTTLTTADGLCGNAVRDIVADRCGRLWVGTVGGGLCHLRDGVVTSHIGAVQLPSRDVRDLEPGSDGTLWVALADSLVRIGPGTAIERYSLSGIEGKGAVQKVLVMRDGTVLAARGREILRLDDGTFSRFVTAPVESGTVRTLVEWSGSLLVGTERGLYRLEGERLMRVPLPGAGPGPLVYDAVAGPSGTLWLATRSGLFSISGGRVQRLTSDNGLPTETIYRVFVDGEGDVWCGTDDGLAKIVPGPFASFGTADGLPSPVVRALAVDGGGRLWAGTRKGVATLEQGNRWRTIVPSLRRSSIFSMEPLGNGVMLVGLRNGLVSVRDGRITRRWTMDDGLPGESVLSLAAGPGSRTVWVGTNGGTVQWVDGTLRQPVDPVLAAAHPMSMAWDGRGRLWIGLEAGGVLVVDGETVIRRIGPEQGLSDQTIWSLSPDGADGMWVGTNGDGAFHVGEDGIRRFSRKEGLANDFVWQVLRTSRGDVWFYTSKGLDRLRGETIRHYGRGAGLVRLEGIAGAAIEDPAGRLWFASTGGLMRYDPELERPPQPLPPVVVLEASSSLSGRIQRGCGLPSPPGVLQFHVAVPFYGDEAAVRFIYRLLPEERSWSEPQRSNLIRFGGVAPGRYRLEVLAVGPGGQRSVVPAVFPFTVLRPWWQTGWAVLGWSLTLIGLAAAFFVWRTARLERERVRLQRLVDERTAALKRQAEELERLATTDELTGVANRRHFLEILEGELLRLARSPEGTRLALVVVDLDGFKEINDTFGHEIGDRLLEAVGHALRKSVRSTDLVARYGGDEFAAILPMTSREGAFVAAGKLLRAIAETRLDLSGTSVGVTASAGVAVVAPSASASADFNRLVRRADLALYAAKRAGKGRIMSDDETLY